MKRVFAAATIAVVVLIIPAGAFLYSAGNEPSASSTVSMSSLHAKVRGFGPGCIGCHIQVAFESDGEAAAGFSKGVHPVREEIIQHNYFDTQSMQCQGCHFEAHESWQSSAHGQAFTNPVFQHAFSRDKKAWCLNCHAPLWNPDTMDAADIARNPDFTTPYTEGVNCVSCHVRNGQITGPNDHSDRQNELFHPVSYDPQMKSEDFCATCHQFNFVQELEPFVIYETENMPMQNTVAEYKHWKENYESVTGKTAKTCTNCHFSEKDHGLKSDAKSDLKEKLIVDLKTEKGPGENHYKLSFKIRLNNLGHHFPTGDLFRILTVYAYDRSGSEIYRYDFRKEVRVVDRKVMRDTTLKPAPGKLYAERAVAGRLYTEPVRCEIVYRLQGSIEPEIIHDFEPGILRQILYSGPCSQAGFFSDAGISR